LTATTRTPTFPNDFRLTAFEKGMDEFCGQGNWKSRDTSPRSFGGPTGVSITGVCVEEPFGEDRYTERLAEAFPFGEVDYRRSNPYPGYWKIEISDNVNRPPAHTYSEEVSLTNVFPSDGENAALGEGPSVTWRYTLDDAS